MIGDALTPSERSSLGKVTKYNGAKDQLFPVLTNAIGRVQGSYFEPFMGSGSVFYRMVKDRRMGPRAVLSDLNPDVINLHRTVRDQVEQLILELERIQREYNALPVEGREKYYYNEVRGAFNALPQPRTGVRAASLFVALLRLDVNGIIRYNQQGLFNISWSKRESVEFFGRITPREVFRADSKLLRESGVSIFSSDFETTARNARPGDTVYTDPPYWNTSSAKQYTIKAFTIEDQRRLKALADRLTLQQTRFVEDNSYDPFILELYCREPTTYVCRTVDATDKIAMDPENRGARNEVIIANRVMDGAWAGT